MLVVMCYFNGYKV